MPRRRNRAAAAVHANAGLTAAYRARLDRLVDEMVRSVVYWISAAYRGDPPEMAADGFAWDASPAVNLQKVMRALSRRWQKRFDEAAPDLARYFSQQAAQRTDAQLKRSLRKGGVSVRYQSSPALNDTLQAAVGSNVSLIRSIPRQFLTQVEGEVMRSVQQGRGLASLTKAIQSQHGVTKRRAAFIALDQNNKATSARVRARQEQLGIEEAAWVHSGGGRHPRPEHVAFSKGRHDTGGPTYKVAKGAYLEGKWVWPGTEIGCRCVSRSIIPREEAA